MLQTREAEAPDAGLRMLRESPSRPRQAQWHRPAPADRRSWPRSLGFASSASLRSHPGLFPLHSATPQPWAGRTGRKALTAAPGWLWVGEMSRASMGNTAFWAKQAQTGVHSMTAARVEAPELPLPIASSPHPSAAGTRRGPAPLLGLGGHRPRSLQPLGLQRNLKTESAGELAETQASPGGQSKAPMQSSRVLKARATAEGNTPPGAGGARALHKPGQRAAKNDGFPFRLLQSFPSEAVKPTNAQPGQPRLENASPSSGRTALGNSWESETSSLPCERKDFTQGKPPLRAGSRAGPRVSPRSSKQPSSPAEAPPAPLPTQLGALLRGGRLLVVGFVGHGAGDAAFAPALAVGGFATFGGDGFFLIVVFPGRVVVLVPAKKQGGKKKKRRWVDLIFRSSNYFSARVWGCWVFFWSFFCWSFAGGRSAFFFAHAGSFPGWIGGGVICGGVFLSAAGCSSTTECTQGPDGDRFNTRPFKFIPASSSFIFLKGTCW